MRRGQRGPDFETVRREAKALLDRIELGQVAPVYVFCGADDYQRQACLRNALNRLVPAEHRETCLINLDGATADARRVARELESTTFRFGDEPRRVVVVRAAPFFAAGATDAAAPLIARLEAGLLDDVVLVCEVDGAVDRRQKLTKLAEQIGVVIEFPELAGEQDVARFLEARLRRAGKRMRPEVIGALTERRGLDAQVLTNEVDKLIAYVGERPEITLDDVRLMVTPTVELSVFDLVDAVAEGRPRAALEQLDALLGQRAEPFMIFGMLCRQYRLLLQARWLLDRGLVDRGLQRMRPFDFNQATARPGRDGQTPLEVWRAAGEGLLPADAKANLLSQHYFVLWKTLGQAARLTTPAVVGAFERLLQCDLGLKTSHLPPATEMELLVADLCRRPEAGATVPWDALLEP